MRKVDLELTAAVEDLRRQLATPVTEEELEERRVAYRSMETLRVKVGPDFNIVDEVRKMRGGWTPKPDA